MKDVILDFIDGLKFRGVRVSVSETMDALKGVTEIGVADKAAFKSVLKATLIKDKKDISNFEELFELFFNPSSIVLAEKSELEKKVAALLDEAKDLFSEEFMGLMQGDPKMMMGLVAGIAQATNLKDIRFPMQSGYFFTKMSGMLSGMGLDRELSDFVDFLRERGYLENGMGEHNVRGIFDARLTNIKDLIRSEIKKEQEKHRNPKKDQVVPDTEGERNFSELSEQEIEDMRDTVKALVRKIKDTLAIRERRVKRGRFDIKRTIRRSLQYGGVPIRVIFRKKKKTKGQLVTICDVSRSVWNASRFMLNLLYSLQDQFDRVRSFVFVSDLGEVTKIFGRYENNEALKRLVSEAGINFYSYTDYGEVLLRFYHDYLDAVNRRTTVIIIGDARNNYMAHNAWVLEKVKKRARKIYWLNPEPERWWGSGDSDMDEFIPYISEARECRNLKQLARFIEDLVV
ncbi:MAG: VWA domain-containing protein [Deltaproteobacteria bacterium]|nr:VWA domain-containing protein [Candidatus Zymogenaceae bacterium]